MKYEIEVNGRPRQVTVHRVDNALAVTVDGKECAVDVARVDGHTLSLLIEEGIESSKRVLSYELSLMRDPATGELTVRVGNTLLMAAVNARRRWGRKDDGAQTGLGPQRIVAPMPGKIVRVLVKEGEAVQARQSVVVIEAMKMENELRAAGNGTMAEIHVQDGQSVDAGALLAVIHR